MNKKLISLSLFTFALVGCVSVVSGSKEVEERGQQEVEAGYSQQNRSDFARLRYSDRYFVPELTREAEDKPGWWFEDVDARIVEMSLESAMMEFVSPLGVNVRYLDGINPGHNVRGLVHSGTIGGLIDTLSFASQFSYQVSNNLLTWSKYQTELVEVRAGTARQGFRIGDDGSATGASQTGRLETVDTGFSSGTEAIVYEFSDIDLWNDVEQTLAALSSEGGRVVANRGSSSVMIRDYPENVSSMKHYLEQLNTNLSISLAIDFKIVEFSQTSQSRRGLNWSVITRDLTSSGLLSFNSNFSGLMAESAPPVLSYEHEAGKYAGSEVLLDVLDANGVSYEVTNQVIFTINNHPQKAVFGRDSGYVAEAGSTATANVGTNQTLRGGVVRTGDEFYMLPNVYGDDIFLLLSASLSSLQDLRTVESGETRIELPELALDQNLGRFRVRDGDTIVLTNSIENSAVNDSSIAGLCFFGCESASTNQRRERLILITPRVIRGH